MCRNNYSIVNIEGFSSNMYLYSHLGVELHVQAEYVVS